jgi:hypothetical protein
MMKVEKDVPLPVKFPFAGMQVGDSFAVPPDVKRPAVTVAAMRFGRRHGMRFTVRQVADKTYRCWRIE